MLKYETLQTDDQRQVMALLCQKRDWLHNNATYFLKRIFFMNALKIPQKQKNNKLSKYKNRKTHFFGTLIGAYFC